MLCGPHMVDAVAWGPTPEIGPAAIARHDVASGPTRRMTVSDWLAEVAASAGAVHASIPIVAPAMTLGISWTLWSLFRLVR